MSRSFRIAIVNNGAALPRAMLALAGRLAGSQTEVYEYCDASRIDPSGYDLIILTGSSQFPIAYNLERLEAETGLIRRSQTPIVGICYGCELIAMAYGGTLRDNGPASKERRLIRIEVDKPHPIFQDAPYFEVYDAHRWTIERVPEGFDVLAHSEHGPELLRHRTRPLWGLQFHPEKLCDASAGDELFMALIRWLLH